MPAGFGPGLGQLELGDRRGQDVVDLVEGVVDAERVLEDRLHVAPEGTPFAAGNIGADPCPL